MRQIVALVSRSEAWHLGIQAAGGLAGAPGLHRVERPPQPRWRRRSAGFPVGPSVGAAAAVLILGSNGVAEAAAAGVLMTVTGTIGGLCFAAWAGADRLWSVNRLAALRRALSHARARDRSDVH